MGEIGKFKLWVVEQVLWAEYNLTGMSGKEKRDRVVQKLDYMIKLPAILEPFDGPIIGFFVDLAVSKLNSTFGHSFGVNPVITQEQEKDIADSLEVSTGEAESLKDMELIEPDSSAEGE